MASRIAGVTGKINHGLSVVLVLILALAPVPLGSNRPVFWVLGGVTIGLAAMVYAVALWVRHGRFRFGAGQLAVPATLMAAVSLWLLVQAFPLDLIGFEWETLSREGAVIATPTISLDPGGTMLMLIRMLTYTLFFFLMLQVAVNRSRARIIIHWIFGIITAHAAYALVALTQLGDPVLFFDKWAYEGVATGTFVNRNSFATFLAFGCVLGLALILRSRQKTGGGHRRPTLLAQIASSERFTLIAMCIALGIIFTALLATQSRMGLAAAVAGMLVTMLISMRHNARNIGLGIGLVLVLAVLGGTALFLLYGQGVLDRLGSLEFSADIRARVYEQVIGMIGRNPFFGYGGGAFELAYPLFQHLPVSPDLRWDRAHSTYLTLWVELGVVFGTLLMLVHMWFAYHLVRRALARSTDWAASTAAFGVIIAGAMHSTVDFSLEMQANVLLLLAIVALGLAVPAPEPAPATADEDLKPVRQAG